MKKTLFSLAGLIISYFGYAQTPRLSLYEEFTGETCPPCASTNPGLDALLAQPANTANCVVIKWQVPIPSAPTKTWSLYQTNKNEIDWRAFSYGYGINSAPSGRMDGQNTTVFGAPSDHPVTLTSSIIATAQSYTSAFNINVQRAWALGCSAVTLTVTIQATANFTAVGSLVFRTVMVEKEIHFTTQPGTNGEKDFYNVAIRSFPSIQAGTPLPAAWTNGQTQTFTLNCPVPSYTRNKNQIAFVGFIQDEGNKKVAQAVRTSTAAIPTEALANTGATVNLSCSGSITPTVSVRNDGVSAITNLTIVPFTDGNAGANTTWSGNLAVGASTTIVLNGVTTGTANGSHLFTFNTLMNVPLYNLTANANSANYMVASNYQSTPVAEGFVANVFPPNGWARVNSDGGAGWSRSNTSGGFNLSYESAKYDFYNNSIIGDKDELFLAPVDLSGPNVPSMSMDLAYAQRDAFTNDKLEVFASDNCGATWTSVFSQAGAALATYTGYVSAQGYVPDPSDATHWKKEIFTLPGFNKSSVLVKLVTTSDHGNNLYVDNINLSQASLLGIKPVLKTENNLLVYPNPANDVVNVQVQSENASQAKVTVVNMIGQTVYEKNLSLHAGATTLHFDTKDFASGVYSVMVETNKGVVVQKFSVTK
ncbi:MAG: T9SS type A sorting domain-containing protein [Bacteroidia bacterium]|nr:T9SS type A sorting domain-containing protein [Bacteroidia bacterium]